MSFQVSFTPICCSRNEGGLGRGGGEESSEQHGPDGGVRGGTIGVSMAMKVPSLPPLPCGRMENKGAAAHLSHLQLAASVGEGRGGRGD